MKNVCFLVLFFLFFNIYRLEKFLSNNFNWIFKLIPSAHDSLCNICNPCKLTTIEQHRKASKLYKLTTKNHSNSHFAQPLTSLHNFLEIHHKDSSLNSFVPKQLCKFNNIRRHSQIFKLHIIHGHTLNIYALVQPVCAV